MSGHFFVGVNLFAQSIKALSATEVAPTAVKHVLSIFVQRMTLSRLVSDDHQVRRLEPNA
ncbi:hypothetical protein [Colwellia sp. MT2012]|uniref:hypothetical protein n=1 Tax=Colwellia sp. MT2012 TaxID=1718921 RepID=UPI000710DEB0|nr:hypothetical protein [Colwellia sp. MT2012]